jgi:hypothetical protein
MVLGSHVARYSSLCDPLTNVHRSRLFCRAKRKHFTGETMRIQRLFSTAFRCDAVISTVRLDTALGDGNISAVRLEVTVVGSNVSAWPFPNI